MTTPAQAAKLDPQVRCRPAPSTHVRAFEEELVILDFANGEYFALDAVGADVWHQLELGASLHEMATSLAARYDVAYEDALRDATSLLCSLMERRLIVRT